MSVPLNTGVLFNFRFNASSQGSGIGQSTKLLANVKIRKKGGKNVDVVVEHGQKGALFDYRAFVWVKPKQPLSPNTAYEVLAPLGKLPCTLGQSCDLNKLAVVLTFRTGTSADTKAPTFSGVNPLHGTVSSSTEVDTCFGAHKGATFPFTWSPAKDDSSKEHITYNVYESGDLSKPLLRFVSGGVMGWLSCSGGNPKRTWAQIPLQASKSYVVRAIDLSGNEDQNTKSQKVADLCRQKPKTPVTKNPPNPESKKPPVSGHTGKAPQYGTGCSIRQQGEGSLGGWFVLCLLFFLLQRENRRFRRP